MRPSNKAFIGGLLLFAGAGLLAHGYFRVAEGASAVNNRWVRHRMAQALEYFDHLPPTRGKVIAFLGSSETEIGIDPVQLDDHLKELGHSTLSVNLGLRNMDSSLILLLTRRVSASLEVQGRRLDLAVVQFIPQHSTRAYSAHFVNASHAEGFADVTAAIYSNSLLLEDFGAQPLETSQLWLTRNIFGGVSPTSVSFYSWSILLHNARRLLGSGEADGAQAKAGQPGMAGDYFGTADLERVLRSLNQDQTDPEAEKRFREEREKDFDGLAPGENREQVYTWYGQQIHPEPAWNPEARGGFYFGYPATRDVTKILFSSYRDPEFMKEYLAGKERDFGLVSLDFDPEHVAAFVSAIAELKRNSSRVLLFYLPDAVPRAPDAEARLNEVLAQIQKQAGVPLLNYFGRPELTEDDYFDRIHPNLSGRNKVARMLAQDLPRFLSETAEPQRQ